METSLPEPWLRGPLEGVNPYVAPVLHALLQVREDLHKHTQGLSAEQVWSRPHGVASLGFHLRHIAGSLDRLTTYLGHGSLDEKQFAFLRTESEPGSELSELLRDVDRQLDATSAAIRALPEAAFADARFVGRQRLPTTVIGLAIHIAEHTQRHTGQAITLCKLMS